MTEKYQPIPHRLKNMAVGGHVAGAEDIDAGNGKTQQDINTDTYRKNETYSKEQLNNMITTPDQEYLSVTATAETTDVDDIATLIATKYPNGKESADTVYRVGCWDGEEYNTNTYAEYVWDGTQYILAGVKNPGIDDEPTVNSSKLVESGGVFPLKFNMAEKTLMTQREIVNGGFLGLIGFVTNQYYQIWIFPVTEGEYYTFTDSVNAGSNLYLALWLSAYDTSGETPSFTILSHEPYQGSVTEDVSYVDQPIKAPAGASYFALNLYNSNNNFDFTNVKHIEELVKSEDLKKDIKQDSVYISEVEGIAESSIARDKYISPTGELVSNNGLDVYYYDVTGGNEYVLSGFLPYLNGGLFLLTWLDENQNVIYTQYKAYYTEHIDVDVKNQIVIAPTNATQAVLNVNKAYTLLCRFGTKGNPIILEEVKKELSEKADIASISENLKVDVEDIFENYFFKPNGDCVSNSAFSIAMYKLEEGGIYSFSGFYPKRTTVPFIAWLDDNGEFIAGTLNGYLYAEPYKGSMDSDTSIYMQRVTPPASAAYAVINIQKSVAGKFGLYKVGDVIDVDALSKEVDNIARGNMEVTISGDPKEIGSQIIVRTAFDKEKDIVVVYYRYLNDDITPLESYIGNKSLQTSEIMTTSNRFHFWYDSTSPLRNGSYAPWHMFAQHGYEIPTVICSHSLTDSDLNTTWTDNEGRDFKLGKIDGNTLYLLPVVSESSIEGVYTRSWKNHVVESAITTLSKGGTTLNITSQNAIQIRPIQDSKELKIIIDGTEVTKEGVYMCNDLVISETLECFNPFTIETWFPTPVKNTVAMELIQSFNIHGLSHRYDAIINMKEPLVFQEYGANQGQCLVNDAFSNIGSIAEGYDAYVMVPKVKKSVNGNRADVPHIILSSSDDIMAYRNSTDLYDADDMPDREITYLYDGEDYLAGFAAGVSLTKGLSANGKRDIYVPANARTINMSYANRNKFYVNLLVSAAFENGVLPAGFTTSFSTYWAYFNPNVNKGQVYWYKDGKDYIIYAHYQDANNNLAVTLPSEMDGLSFDVVEKTDGVTLITDNIVNGKIYLNTDNSDNNYVVLKTK